MYTWRAVYRFSHKWIDQPIEIGSIKLYPPLTEHMEGCMHYYELTTKGANKKDQNEVYNKTKERLNELIELAVLSRRFPIVELISITLVDSDSRTIPLNRTLVSNMELLPPYNPKEGREQILSIKPTYEKLQTIKDSARFAIGRSLRWQYKAMQVKESIEDKFICNWIAFNSLYSLYEELKGFRGTEIERIRQFVSYFGSAITARPPSLSRVVQILRDVELKDRRGNDVSQKLSEAYAKQEDNLYALFLESLYIIRCEIFHGERYDTNLSSQKMLGVASSYLTKYVSSVIPAIIDDLLSNNSNV